MDSNSQNLRQVGFNGLKNVLEGLTLNWINFHVAINQQLKLKEIF